MQKLLSDTWSCWPMRIDGALMRSSYLVCDFLIISLFCSCSMLNRHCDSILLSCYYDEACKPIIISLYMLPNLLLQPPDFVGLLQLMPWLFDWLLVKLVDASFPPLFCRWSLSKLLWSLFATSDWFSPYVFWVGLVTLFSEKEIKGGVQQLEFN